MKPEGSSDSLTQLVPHEQDIFNDFRRLLQNGCEYSLFETFRSVVCQDGSDETTSENAADTSTRTHVTKRMRLSHVTSTVMPTPETTP
jgi:hypothetical protein